jgi:hypothetical protein
MVTAVLRDQTHHVWSPSDARADHSGSDQTISDLLRTVVEYWLGRLKQPIVFHDL